MNYKICNNNKILYVEQEPINLIRFNKRKPKNKNLERQNYLNIIMKNPELKQRKKL